MQNTTTERGFQIITHDAYIPEKDGKDIRLVQQSSAIDFMEEDANQRISQPGSSFLWIGKLHHLNREEVKELRNSLTHWLKTGKLF